MLLLPACIWWQQRPKTQNVGREDLSSQKDRAEKKLFLGTEFQEVIVAIFSGQMKREPAIWDMRTFML